MNQLVVADTRANLDLAKAFSEAKMVPEHFKKSVGDCFIAVTLAERLRMDPWVLMQELYIIQGKPMMSGKLVIAILNGNLADPIRPAYEGEGPDRQITITGRPHGASEPLSIKLKVRDAKTANEQWTKNPDQMLMYAGARQWGRRYTPDLILGIVFDDEEITPNRAPIIAPPAATPIAAPTTAPELIDEETGEIITQPTELPAKPGEEWRPWAQRLLAGMRSSPDATTVDRWLELNARDLNVMREEKPTLHATFMNGVQQLKLQLIPGEST